MKLDKLSRLISALNEPAQKTQSEEAKNTKGAEASNSGSEAVSLSADLAASEESGEARRKKFEDIKARVQSGAYQVNSPEVAKSIIKELMM